MRRRHRTLVGLLALGLVAGCEARTSTRAIREARIATVPSKLTRVGATSAQRFGLDESVPAHGHGGARGLAASAPSPMAAPADDSVPSVRWEAPPTWVPQEARGMRLATFLVGSRTECYLSALAGDGGGLAANVNRWRDQMGQPPLAPADLDTLPRVKALGQDVPLLEVAGSYAGSNPGETREGSALLALAIPSGDRMLFVKMIGPAEEVRAERERFVAFCGSLRSSAP